MPLARYFLYVGGALLALLLIANACMPSSPVADRANSRPATIRIHSDQKLPEHVVYDTRLPTIVPPPLAQNNTLHLAPTIADVPAKTREAFAQLQFAEATTVRPSVKKPEGKLQRQRKVARKHLAPREFRIARQPYFGWFGSITW
jgi:hypothetical protein